MSIPINHSSEGTAAIPSFTSEEIYKAIADGELAFDLYQQDISETFKALVFRDQATLDFNRLIEKTDNSESSYIASNFSVNSGAELDYDGHTYTVTLVGATSIILQSESGSSEIDLDVLRGLFDQGQITIHNLESSKPPYWEIEENYTLSPKQLEAALERAHLIELADINPLAVTVSKRSIQRYRKAVREAGPTAIDKNIALVSQVARRGNRQRKIPKELIALIHEVTKKDLNKPSAISVKYAYKRFRGRCEELGLKPCSEKTFARESKVNVSVLAREGKKQAYQKAPIVWYLQLNEPVHGVRPFQYIHIDHTPLDILLRSPNSTEVLGRPWLSLATDAESRAVVAFYLSFESPSYRSCMMVLRDMVRRNGRLPDMVITDNGKEFHSYAFRRVCKIFDTHLRYRPSGQPRHGSVMERLFGTLDTELIHNLEGNTKVLKHIRTVTKSIHPSNFVDWTLPALHGALDYYFRSLYGAETHPAHGESPEEHLKKRLVETGVRRNRWVRYDRTFLIETCPAVDLKGTRKIDGQRGIKVNHIWYWSDEFYGGNWSGKTVEVRIDPWDVRMCYVLLGQKWEACKSKLTWRLRNYTEIELRYAFQELGLKHGIKKKELTPERIAEWLMVMDARNFDVQLHKQQDEAKRIYSPLNMTAVESETQLGEIGTISDELPYAALPKTGIETATATATQTASQLSDADVQIDKGDKEIEIDSEGEFELF